MNKETPKLDTQRNLPRENGRERKQPYASEQEDYANGPAKPPRETKEPPGR
jgi:hypothetical protein